MSEKEAKLREMSNAYRMKASNSLHSSQQGFYTILTNLCWMTLEDDPNELNRDSLPAALLTYMINHHTDFTEGDLAEARNQIRGIISPDETLTPHLRMNKAAFDEIAPETLFTAARIYKIADDEVKAALPKLPEKFVEKYDEWNASEVSKRQQTFLSYLEKDDPFTREEMRDHFAQRAAAVTRADIRKAYNHLVLMWSKQSQLALTYNTDSQYKNAVATAHQEFIDVIAKEPEMFQGLERKLIARSLKTYIAPGDNTASDKKGSKVIFSQIHAFPLFKALHLFGMSKELELAVENKTLPQRFRTAYPDWAKKNKAFIEECQTSLTDLTSKTNTIIDEDTKTNGLNRVTPADASSISVISKDAEGDFDIELKRLINMGDKFTREDMIRVVVLGKTEAPTTARKRLYEFLERLYKPDNPNLEDSRSPNKRQKEGASIVAAYFQHIDTYANEFTLIDEKEIIAKSLPQYIEGLGATESLKKKFAEVSLQDTGPHCVFRACHFYGVGEALERSIENKTLPQRFRTAYPDWAKKNKMFIEECQTSISTPNSSTNANEVDQIVSVEDTSTLSPAVENPNPKKVGIEETQVYYTRKISQASNPKVKKIYELLLDNLMFLKDIAQSSPTKQSREKDVESFFNKARKIILFAAENYGEFEADTHTEVRKELIGIFAFSTIIKPDNDSIKAIRTLTQKVPPYLLFKAVHVYGLNKEFENGIHGITSPALLARFKKWTSENQEFVADCELANKYMPSIALMIKARNEATDPEAIKILEIGKAIHSALLPSMFLSRGRVDTQIATIEEVKSFTNDHAQMIKALTESWHLIPEDVRPFFSSVAAIAINVDYSPEHPLSILPTADVFAFVEMTGTEDALEAFFKKNNLTKISFADYERWKAAPESYLEPVTAPHNDNSRVTYIEVAYPLVTRGKRDEGMGYRPIDDEAQQLEAGSEDANLDRNRTEKIKEALLQNASIRHLTIRRDVRQMDNKSGRPYHLIDVDMEDGSRSRIAVCDFVGNMTFIERDAPPLVENTILDLEALRKNKNVWHVIHINDKQWMEGIQEVLYTPLDKMSPALKNKSYWYSLGDVAVQSLVTKFMVAGRAPPTVDTKTLIDCGPLEGRSKYNLLYSAWNRGSIKGFEKGTTFSVVLKSLVEGEDAPMPWLKKFENKPQLTAESILAASERFKREWGFAVQQGFYDELLIDTVDARVQKDDPDLRRTGIEADMAFKFRAVAINDNDLAKWGRYPDGLDDFMALSGVIELPDRVIA